MQLPREILVGPDAINDVRKILEKLGFHNRILILTGEKTKIIAGERVEKQLKEAGYKITLRIVGKASVEEANIVAGESLEDPPSVVIGIGGGSVIDMTKVVASKLSKPYISIPTTASHDGIASPRASIKGTDKVYSIEAEAPLAIIADTNIIRMAPYRFFASGCADLISNSTAVMDWRLAHLKTGEYFGDYAASLSNMAAEIIIKNAQMIKEFNDQSIRVVLEALISSGVAMSIAGSSRPASGSEHLFSHSIDLLTSNTALHGEKCGVGTIIAMYLHKGDWKLIRKTLKIIGAPTTAEELGLPKNILVEALLKAPGVRPDRYTIFNEVKLDYSKADRILKKIAII
ncbi:MAG: NAD(P)-dependent glycerol-1-phosphate dehydrogenase [Candidatus Odinarchaeum yellowstonii]|uniref:Glycerol-1-phosphate dehydrogenase [NAD(P)+] n=1 Tax=Odinarchaeota yellowstonii (strain LCB_4) TaxID=1841599 RepID=A0AAF0D366_ODILC|nr:MAG: NAD(P)-dependent glycerol-1-phosphate dehydrogenase [Candidatus Odinarchaeum yellowstonii]